MVNRLFNLAVDPTDLGMSLLKAGTQAEAQAVIGVSGGVAGVSSVNGMVGDVNLVVSDLPNDAGYITNADIPDAPVVSINGKSGVVTLTAADVGAIPSTGTPNTFPYFSEANVVTLGAVGTTGLASMGATNAAAGRSAIGAADATAVVDLTTNQTVGGNKNLIANTTFGTNVSGVVTRAYVGNDGSYVQFYKTSGNSGTDRPTILLADATAGVNTVIRNLGVSVQIYASFSGVGDRGFSMESNALRPTVDNVMSSATAAVRWTQIFAANATIGTSDARLKKNFRKLSDAEVAAFTELQDEDWVWEWIENGDRIHSGPTVQAAISILEKHGLLPMTYSFVCYDKWDATDEVSAGDRYSFRKEELLLWLTAANHARLKRLEALL